MKKWKLIGSLLIDVSEIFLPFQDKVAQILAFYQYFNTIRIQVIYVRFYAENIDFFQWKNSVFWMTSIIFVIRNEYFKSWQIVTKWSRECAKNNFWAKNLHHSFNYWSKVGKVHWKTEKIPDLSDLKLFMWGNFGSQILTNRSEMIQRLTWNPNQTQRPSIVIPLSG